MTPQKKYLRKIWTKITLSMKKIHMILALDSNNGLWKDWDLAWRIPEDMKYFKEITTGEWDTKNAVIMWRKTWDSIPEKFRPLPWRINAILSRSYTPEDNYWNICKYSSVESSIEKLSKRDGVADIFILWGAQIYNYVLEKNLVDTMYLTRVKWNFDCDVFVDIDFDQFEEESIWEWQESKNGIKFRFEVYTRK